ncbi:NUDIX domain-containing protein [Rhodococcus sp. HNM0569]|uniref:NUDIX hydrolase n=1 Tax=Rhodococcus sp. HNM0569 TaxID=2716340 RepID=UPI00146B1793|nr:NUDIX domain-containing protein [Rhodococcus sp. HNM0569]NLU83138.1 NUDIX domain-containing protein [Rhodococcus sp. HNM0569]
MSRVIRTAALAHIRDRRLLQARSHGKAAFYMAGGKLDPGEDAETALHREIREELDAAVVPGTLALLDVFEAPAWGHAEGTDVQITCFLGELGSEPTATSEIAEVRYFTRDEYRASGDVAPGSLLVFDRLHELGLVD